MSKLAVVVFCMIFPLLGFAGPKHSFSPKKDTAEEEVSNIKIELASVQNWEELGSESDGIQLYTGDVKGSSFEAFKGVMTVNASLKTLVQMFQDVEKMPDWMYSTVSVEILEQISPVETIRYLINEIPYPFMKDRDLTVHTKIEQKIDKTVVIRMVKVADVKESVSGKVRIPFLDTTVKFIPKESGNVQVEYSGHIEPGGIIMGPVYNLMIKNTPLETLRDFRSLIKEYTSKDVSNIEYIQNVDS